MQFQVEPLVPTLFKTRAPIVDELFIIPLLVSVATFAGCLDGEVIVGMGSVIAAGCLDFKLIGGKGSVIVMEEVPDEDEGRVEHAAYHCP